MIVLHGRAHILPHGTTQGILQGLCMPPYCKAHKYNIQDASVFRHVIPSIWKMTAAKFIPSIAEESDLVNMHFSHWGSKFHLFRKYKKRS